MSAPPFDLYLSDEAKKTLLDLQQPAYRAKYKKVTKALRLLEEQGPRYPAPSSHLMQSMKGPGGETLWESYVENDTPSAWRMFWVHGPNADAITVVAIGPHPD